MSFTKVIKLYKQLYITRNQTFQDDQITLTSKRMQFFFAKLDKNFTFSLIDSLARLRNEFRLNKNESDPQKIQEVNINLF